ncbi:MAG: phosphoribosylglycinamide formyltransferase [Pirellulales bacterium]
MSNKGNTQPLRLAVLLSGSGRTLENLLQREKNGELSATVELVLSNREGVRGVTIAESAGIRTIVNPQGEASLETWSASLFGSCREANVDLVVMAGFLQLVAIPDDFVNRVINIHPSLLPAFGGKGFYGNRVHAAVIEHGATTSGCTVHFVDNEYDHGSVLLQRQVPVTLNDSPETLAARVFREECQALPEAINLLAKRQLTKQ